MTNFAAFPATGASSFLIQYVQHEPGPECTPMPLLDKPFSQNLDECLRYYQKTYDYAVLTATNTAAGVIQGISIAGTGQYLPLRFQKPMAKIPSMYTWGYTGTPNAVNIGGTDYGISSHVNIGTKGFGGWVLATSASALYSIASHYTADTGW
jgi:hypothetical protein